MYEDAAPVVEAMLAAIAEVVNGNLRARLQTPEDSPDLLKSLGEGVNKLIAAWRASELQARKTKRSLEAQVATVEAQALAIRELSTPILQIWRDVILLPLVGRIDETRSADISRELLAQIAQTQTNQVIIDVTGIEFVDERTADHLLRLVRSAKLLGARCVVTGVNAAVAQTFVQMGADLSGLRTLRTLENGLLDCVGYSDRLRGNVKHNAP
jgi:rsbT co-antagonist protein RsbR